ncbi:MAG: hypothetical protein ACT4OP_11430 [Actinomycetota bacterium]
MRKEVLVGLVGLTFALATGLRLLIAHDSDPSALAAFGEDSARQNAYARELVGEVVTRPAQGHDGKFFFIQGNDPWLLHPNENASFLDRPVYRAQRMAYPLLASGFGLLSPWAVMWGLFVINVIASGIGTWATARLATGLGVTPWLGLAFTLNVGLIYEMVVDGAGIVALMFGVLAILALERQRSGWAGGFLAAAALSREVMLVFAVGIAAAFWIRHRRVIWSLLVVPGLAFAVWSGYTRFRLGWMPDDGSSPVGAYPFRGLVQAASFWGGDFLDLVLILAFVAVTLAFTLRAVRSRQLLVWGALPFALLATMLTVYVWLEPYDIARAIAPIFTAYPFVLFVAEPKLSADQGMSREHAFD